MSTPALRDILLGGFAYFIESGTVITDATPSPYTSPYTVSATVKPDIDPATNWTAHSLGNILDFKFGVEEEDYPVMRVLPNGSRVKVPRKIVVADFLDLTAQEMNELCLRLQHGVTTKIVEGTAQTPGATNDRRIDGWLRLQGRAMGNFDVFIQDWWCQVRLIEGTKADGKFSEPKLRFHQYKAVNGVMVAGDSCNFPVAS